MCILLQFLLAIFIINQLISNILIINKQIKQIMFMKHYLFAKFGQKIIYYLILCQLSTASHYLILTQLIKSLLLKVHNTQQQQLNFFPNTYKANPKLLSIIQSVIKTQTNKMGQAHPQPALQAPTPQKLQQSYTSISKNQSQAFTLEQILPNIKNIMNFLRLVDPISKKQQTGDIIVNQQTLKFIFSPYFSKQLQKLTKLLVLKLQDLSNKNLSFVKVTTINELSFLTDFILYFSNQKILENFDSLLVRSDLCEENRTVLKNMAESAQGGQLQVNGNIVQKIPREQLQNIEKVLRVTLVNFINLRLKPLSRSQKTLSEFSNLQQSLFLLYTKIYFTHNSSIAQGARQHNIPQINQHLKSNVTIGAYFVSMGAAYSQPALYEAAVVFLYSFLKLEVEYKEIKTLPSHIFKNLPIISTNSIYQYILCTVLYSLKYIKEQNQVYLRFAFNRILSLKLVQILLKNTKVKNKTITYYLQQLCLQVKIGQIQRACVYESIQLYQKSNPQIKSQIFTKFLANTSKIKYNLKFPDRNIKITQQQLLTQLQDDGDLSKKQYFMISFKFILQKILRRPVVYNFNDKILWQQMLPHLMDSKQDQEVMNMENYDRKKRGQNQNHNGGIMKEKQDDDHDQENYSGDGYQYGDAGEKKEHVSVLQVGDDGKNQRVAQDDK